MRNLLLRHFKMIATIAMALFILTACNLQKDDALLNTQKTETNGEVEQSKTQIPSPSSFKDYDAYIDYISSVPNFEPYYQTAFDFEMLSEGISSVPIEALKAMYNEMKTAFDYVLVNDNPLIYRGNYDGEADFVHEFYQSQTANTDMDNPNPINVATYDWEGNEILTTPLKTLLLGESIFNQFDNSIQEGRNLNSSDFTLSAPNEPINVVLGHAYKDIYKLGDTFSLEFISEVMNFQVVGFYKPGVEFSMEIGALRQVNFDHTIVMPYFIPDYEPIGEASVFQHAFHIAELTSGYIGISKPTKKINEAIYDDTIAILEEMAKRNNLSNHYRVGYWPVGFVW